MCGIAALSQNPKDTSFDAGVAAAALLRGIENRGRHATGAAWYRPADDTLAVTKLPVTATTFLKHREAILPERTPAMLLHTRYATHGNVEDRENNHPIQHENVVGIHNGVLQNHRDIFTRLGRQALTPVDTEAIMALLDAAEGHPTEVLGELRGDAALAWIDLREPEVLHLAQVSGRPLAIAQTEGGSLMAASTMRAVEDAARAAKVKLAYREEIPDAKYLRVVRGSVAEYLDIQNVVKAEAGWRKQYAWTSGQGAAKAAPKAARPSNPPAAGKALPAPAKARVRA